MKTKIITIIIAAAAVLGPASLFADEGKVVSKQSLEKSQPATTAYGIVAEQQNMAQSVAFINDLENPAAENAGDPIDVSYNDDGTISMVVLYDGTVAEYSYERDANGGIISCTINTASNSIVFTNLRGAEDKPGEGGVRVEVFTKKKTETGDERRDKVLELYYAKGSIDLEDVAKKPIRFDFGEINKAIAKASEMKSAALKEYEKGLSSYYNAVEAKIKEHRAELAAGDSKLAALLKSVDDAGMLQKDRRAVVDEIVNYIENLPRDAAARGAVKDIVAVEKDMRAKVAVPEKEIYEGKVAAAIDYINGMIDKLLESRIALYLNVNVKKDRIDAIINLPETPPKN